MNREKRRLVVISLDAFHTKDLDKIKDLPTFKEILKSASVIKAMKGIYPSLTYCSHATMLTGNYPKDHGVYNNEFCNPFEKVDRWFWHYKNIKSPTLVDYALKENLKVASILWPVMAGAKISINFPEIWSINGENQVLTTLKNGTPFYILKEVLRHGRVLKGKKQPALDEFVTRFSEDVIKEKKPNLTLIHLLYLDYTRHHKGVFNKDVDNVLMECDKRIGRIIKACKDAKIYDSTNFVIVGDHGFNDIEYKSYPNEVFKNENLIILDSKGELKGFTAYSKSCGGSAQIHINGDNNTRKQALDLLERYKSHLRIKKIYIRDEFIKKGLDGPFDFVIEGYSNTCFSNDYNSGSYIKKAQNEDYRGNHGFDPDTTGYTTPFIAFGPDVREGIIVESGVITQVGSTLSRLLNIKGLNGEGFKEILKSYEK